jgi:arginine decarboxylase
MEQFSVPGSFFVVAGNAQDGASELNAFDMALKDAGITQCNLVNVSSILPADCKEISPLNIPPGAITYCVMAKMSGTSGEHIGCGIGWAWGTLPDGGRYGIVAEHHGYCDEEYTQKKLLIKLKRMAEVRKLTLTETKTCIKSMEVKESKYGCVVTALVYTN